MEYVSTCTDIDLLEIRLDIVAAEQLILDTSGSFIGDNDVCPLKHTFSDGIYVREIFIPAGTVLTGKIHKHAHPNFLMSGKVEVFTESGGKQKLEGPLSMISEAGTKRVVYAITDAVWITVHENKNNITNIDEIEKFVIADTYEDYEKFKKIESSNLKKISNFVKLLFNKIL